MLDLNLNISSTASFTNANNSDTNKVYDIIIIGAGPAGLNAALYSYRKGMDVLILSKTTGGQVVDSSGIENYLGFKLIKGHELATIFEEQINSFNIPIVKTAVVTDIKQGQPKEIALSDGRVFKTKSVIIATGTKNKQLNIPGEQEYQGKGVSYCAICDGPFFRNKDIVIVGGGNTGVESVIDLSKIAKSIKLVHYKDKLKADKILVEKLSTLPNAEIIYNHKLIEIKGTNKVDSIVIENVKTQEQQVITADGVFIEIGLLPISNFVQNTLALTSTNEIIIDAHCKTSEEGIFAAGDVTNVPYKQISIAVGEGAKAALTACEYVTKL